MSRSSMRMKHYRPISADFTKTNSSSSSTLSNVFGLNQEQNRDSNKSGVLLINYKKSTPECSPANSPFLKSRSPKISSADSSLVINGTTAIKEDAEIPDGLAPIAKTEEMSDDLSEETLVNGEAPNSSTPKKDSTVSTSSWRLTNGNSVVQNKSSVSGDPPWWSDEDDDEKTDRESKSYNGNRNEKNNSQNSVEDEFESFSCTDEEDEGDRLSLDSNSTSR